MKHHQNHQKTKSVANTVKCLRRQRKLSLAIISYSSTESSEDEEIVKIAQFSRLILFYNINVKLSLIWFWKIIFSEDIPKFEA